MANNRMYLIHRPTGRACYLGKRMGWGWYDTPTCLTDSVMEFFAFIEENGDQDDVCIGLEDAERATVAAEICGARLEDGALFVDEDVETSCE